ncbi:MAG: hypothetical protein IJD77_00495 [Clostridia bacterium]|nr:hypothetical protein [Clostridia bacterium]
MKKGIYLALSMMLVLGSFTACGGKDKDKDNTSDPITSETPAGSEGEGSEGGEGGEVIEPVEIPEDLDVAGAIAFGKDYASRVTHGAGALISTYADPEMSMYDSTTSVIYALNDKFVYTNEVTGEDEYAEEKECWFSLDANGDIFAVKNGAPYDEEPSEDMMNGYGFNVSDITGNYASYYGVDALVSNLYNIASEQYAYYQQCLEDAQTANDATLIANVEYVIENCGFQEMAMEVEGQKMYMFSLRMSEYYVYETNVVFTLSEYGYIEMLSVSTEKYSPDFYTVETKEVTLADEENGVPAATADVLVKNEEATFSNTYTIAIQQNVELDGVELPTENAYAADAVLATDFTMSKDGAAVESGAVLELRAGDSVNFEVALSEGAVSSFNEPVFSIDGEVVEWASFDSRIALSATNNYDDNGVATLNGITMTAKQVGEFTVGVKIGAAEKTLTVKIAAKDPTYINAYAYNSNMDQVNEITVYAGVQVDIYATTDDYTDNSHTMTVDSEDATLTAGEYFTSFVSNVVGTYTVTVTSTVVEGLTDTFVITVEAAPSVADILSGYYEVYDWNGSKVASLVFTPASEGAMSGTVAVDKAEYSWSTQTTVNKSAVFSYEYTEATGLSWTYVSGDEMNIYLAITANYGLQLDMQDCVKVDAPTEEPEVEFASELYYDENAGLYLIVNKAEKLAFICSSTDPNAFDNQYSMLISYTISSNGAITVEMIRSMTAEFFTLTGTGNYYAGMNAAEIGYVHPMSSMNMNFWFAVVESGEEGGEEGGDEGSLGIEGTINVTTTDTYCWVDKCTFTAEKAGTYTFTVPAGLGVWEAEAYETDWNSNPFIDYYANENGDTFSVTLAEGEEFSFYVAATTKGDWVISYVA